MLTAKLVCIEASAPHPHRPSHPTSCLISFTLSYQTLSMPPCTKILCECIQPPAFSPWPASCLFYLSITGLSFSDPMLYLHLFPKGGHLAHNTKSSPWVYREVRGNPGYRRVPVHQDNQARVRACQGKSDDQGYGYDQKVASSGASNSPGHSLSSYLLLPTEKGKRGLFPSSRRCGKGSDLAPVDVKESNTCYRHGLALQPITAV